MKIPATHPFTCLHCNLPGIGTNRQKYHGTCSSAVETIRKRRAKRRERAELVANPPLETIPERLAWFEVTSSPRSAKQPETIVSLISEHQCSELLRFEGRDKTTTRKAMEFAHTWATLFGWNAKLSVENSTPFA